ncbi:aldose 1-epimerase family protein [Anaerorhabdus sp.]|uniref:aldose 1-epimerase family protein n=1 Tax=Anaerorhabdus sp. TaxID=1872524 RepID=UPI002FC7D511
MELKNERYVVTFTQKGGEIESFLDTKTNIQYMWQGDQAHWSGKNPTLFPLIGNTYTNSYEINGKEYSMKNHGLIRHATLSTKQADENTVIMELASDENTLSQYPFPFHYEVCYTLDNNKLTITYHIRNTGTEEMPFTFGLHPGFNCPIEAGENFEDYTLKFSNKENFEQLVFDPKKEKPYELKPIQLQEIPCNYKMIEDYATLIYKNPRSAYITLQGKGEHGVNVSLTGYPLLAIWTASQGAPFICIEPWYGHGDFSKVEEDFYHREGTMILSPNKTFTTSYSIEVF